jgi:hippurate hydrolase
VARGAAMTAGLPEELMPVVTVEDPYTPSTFNDPDFTQARAAAFRERFGEERVMEWPAVMGGEDFSQFRRAAPDDVESMIFWISGTPAPMLQALKEDGTPLPSLHSPYWAPDAEAVIATGAEALAGAAMDLMPRG